MNAKTIIVALILLVLALVLLTFFDWTFDKLAEQQVAMDQQQKQLNRINNHTFALMINQAKVFRDIWGDNAQKVWSVSLGSEPNEVHDILTGKYDYDPNDGS